MNRNDEQTASKTHHLESEPLLAQKIWSRFIKIPPGPIQRRLYSLFEPSGTNHDPMHSRLFVGSNIRPKSKSRDAFLLSRPKWVGRGRISSQ